MTPPQDARAVLEELDKDDQHRTRRERQLTAVILIIGLAVALLTGYAITDTDIGYSSIRCEKGDVVLILERADGVTERVECPVQLPVTP